MPNPSKPLRDLRVLPTEGKQYMCGSIVKVVVGQESNSRTFSMHEDLLRDRSEFFRRALNGNWKESDEKLVKLPEEDADTFLLYAQLVYDNVLPIEHKDYLPLAKLYVLAEMLQDTMARNVVIDAFIATSRDSTDGGCRFPGETALDIVYQGTPESSPARRLMVDLWVYNGSSEWFSERLEAYNKEFLFDLAKESFKKRALVGHNTTKDCDPTEYHIVDPVLPKPDGISEGSDSAKNQENP